MGDNENSNSLREQRKAAVSGLQALHERLTSELKDVRNYVPNKNYFAPKSEDPDWVSRQEIDNTIYDHSDSVKLRELFAQLDKLLEKIQTAKNAIEADILHRGGKLHSSDFTNKDDADRLAAAYESIAKQAKVLYDELPLWMVMPLDNLKKWGEESNPQSCIQMLENAIDDSAKIRAANKQEGGAFRKRVTTSESSSASSSSGVASSESNSSVEGQESTGRFRGFGWKFGSKSKYEKILDESSAENSNNNNKNTNKK